MDPFADQLNRQRHLTPPPDAVHKLEQRVMGELDGVRIGRRRAPILILSASMCCTIIVLAMLIFIRPSGKPATSPDFVESIVILDDHTCIWLERAESVQPSGQPHE